jgi:predicted DNA-binding protein
MMYDPYIVKRTQIYLDPAQSDALASRAKAAGTTSSQLIREAVGEYLAGPTEDDLELARQRTAIVEAFGAVPHLPDPATYLERIRIGEVDRDEWLEEQWRSS